MQSPRPPLYHYYTNHKIPAGQHGDLYCDVACMYTQTHLYVVVSTRLSLHGPRLTRARNQVIEHLLTLLRVPPEKLHRVVYFERYTHQPEAQWLQVNLRNHAPATVQPAPEALKEKLQAELLAEWGVKA